MQNIEQGEEQGGSSLVVGFTVHIQVQGDSFGEEGADMTDQS